MAATLNSVDIRLLRVFTTVVECGGFSAAQVELNVSQSTISTQMADLETRLGSRLCQRGRAGFSLTDNGRAVYAACQRLFRSLDEFSVEVAELGGRLAGDLHIAMLDNMISNPACRLHDAITRFKARDEAVHLTIHVAPPIDIERAVLDGRDHIGIGTFPIRVPGLRYHRLFRETMSLYCGRDHPLFAGSDTAASRGAIENAEYVKRGYATQAHSGQFTPRNITATAFNMEAVAMMVLSGRFIGHLPDHYTTQWVADGMMRRLEPDVFGFRSDFEVILRKGQPRNAVIELFVEDLTAAFADNRNPSEPGGGIGEPRRF